MALLRRRTSATQSIMGRRDARPETSARAGDFRGPEPADCGAGGGVAACGELGRLDAGWVYGGAGVSGGGV